MAHLKTKETHGDPSRRLQWKTKLVRMLAQRFEEVPAWALEKLDQASQEELERWGARILEAEVIEDVFSPQ
jgi:hypothetical protein